MNINMNAISATVNMPVYTSIKDKQAATHEDAYLKKLISLLIHAYHAKIMN